LPSRVVRFWALFPGSPAPRRLDAEAEIAIRTEGDHSAVVIGRRLGDGQQDLGAGRVGHGWIGGHVIAGQDHRSRVVCIGNEEMPVALVVRMKGEAEETLLVSSVTHERDDVEER
jgi:hypothetical protein